MRGERRPRKPLVRRHAARPRWPGPDPRRHDTRNELASGLGAAPKAQISGCMFNLPGPGAEQTNHAPRPPDRACRAPRTGARPRARPPCASSGEIGQRLLIQLDHPMIVSADDQERWRPDARRARHPPDPGGRRARRRRRSVSGPRRRHQSRGRARAGAEVADGTPAVPGERSQSVAPTPAARPASSMSKHVAPVVCLLLR